MAISENKLLHTLGVARECERLAEQMNLSAVEQTACFVMGFLHDIGYEKTTIDNAAHHPYIGADMIDAFVATEGVVEAIRNHGSKTENLTVFDEILNRADLTTDYKGNHITIEERLASIKNKYGEAHRHYKNARAQAEALMRPKTNLD